VTFAEIVKSSKANKTWTADELKAITLKAPDHRRKVGHSLPQFDIPAKTDGTCKFGIDASVPGMLYGEMALPPVRFGATVKSVNDSAAKKVAGLLASSKPSWSTTRPARLLAGWLPSRRPQKDGTEGLFFVKDGDSAAAMEKAAKVIEAEYLTASISMRRWSR